eukprot:CAMPEP_0204217890 /NCGR_PEP_ID=MMETSP0361-20130328/79222_1 /ASSEMBLY_ACC=CAM_ASM_000343 /TAXON_ID=268821 /ORGANISM="Scrippsiella Hangoei, Strain SHTV-5" /LENGTH=67 /DNA_ID=CAMNT_0051182953 /DNA_START=60 /DNA_END=260 /DNA_ORIENTATION=-
MPVDISPPGGVETGRTQTAAPSDVGAAEMAQRREGGPTFPGPTVPRTDWSKRKPFNRGRHFMPHAID